MSEKNYISCIQDYKSGNVMVWERDITGGPRTLKLHNPPMYFYVPDDAGEYTTITKQKVKKLVFTNSEEYQSAIRRYQVKFESDIRPDSRILMNEYFGRATPIVNYSFLDIEVDYDSEKGWATIENPYAEINAITIYQSWTKSYVCLAVPPKNWNGAETFEQDIIDFAKENNMGFIPKFVICRNERELLTKLIEAIDDADIISGWNSDFFDNPYIIKRLEKVFGVKGPMKMCFPGAGMPRLNMVEQFGNQEITYDLKGRTHIDFMAAFKKFTFEGRTSYSLANIAAEELDIDKIDTGITLQELYNKFFYKFCVYNCRDTEILVRLNMKFKFIELINQMAHENTVPYAAIMGTVRYVDMGITNRVHKNKGLVTIDKPIIDKNAPDLGKVEGAVVFDPLAGLWKMIGSVDINSLYPSVIRALNMSYETYIGQFVGDVDDWRGIMDHTVRTQSKCPNGLTNIRYRTKSVMDFDNTERIYVMNHRDGSVICKTAPQWRKWFVDNNYAISAFGTVFDQTEEGVVAETLTYWFIERKRLQSEKKRWGKIKDELIKSSGVGFDSTDGSYTVEYRTKKVHKRFTQSEWVSIAEAIQNEEHFDLLQLTKKIQLNSTYGALLNKAFRYNRRELGASVTATGREITMFMAETIGEIISGESVEIMKYQVKGTKNKIENHYVASSEFIIYGDTDSSYFRLPVDTVEDAILLADEIASATNATFAPFMSTRFICTPERSELIKAVRELVAIRGLFLDAKKKYTLRVIDKEGKTTDELKSMGSEIKKADTPKSIQKFLKQMMDLVLDDSLTDDELSASLETHVNSNRRGLIHKVDDLLSIGVAKQINNLEKQYVEWQRTEKVKNGKVRLPGHVRAAINYNELLIGFHDTSSKILKSGDKGVIFYVKNNEYGISNIAFPSDITKLPDWFTENFKVDLHITEEKMIDMKLEGIFNALKMPIPTPKLSHIKKSFVF